MKSVGSHAAANPLFHNTDVPDDGDDQTFPGLLGDPYPQPSDVLRGISLPSLDFSSQAVLVPHGWNDSKPCHKHDEFEVVGIAAGLSCEDAHVAWKTSFENRHPPKMPTDPFFTVAETTLRPTCGNPIEIGKLLLFFLKTKVSATLTKMNETKCSVKVDVFLECLNCSIKARIYTCGHEQYAVEFQRRSGDVICFHKVFRKAAAYFDIDAGDSQPMSALSLPDAAPSGADLTPLLDMACSSSSQLQLEAAAALNCMAIQGTLSSLSMPDVLSAVVNLLSTGSAKTTYVAACLVSRLAQMPDVSPLVVAHQLLTPMLESILSTFARPQTSLWLSQALNAAVRKESGYSSDAIDFCKMLSRVDLRVLSSSGLSQEVVESLEVVKARMERVEV
jgi:hypothetical protein